MAFTGVAAITKISDRKFRITGLSLAAGASGDIGLVQNANADVQLTAPGWDRYETSGVGGGLVELDDAIEVRYCVAEAALAVTEPLSIVKSGNGPADFLATLTNPDAAASGALEIYVEFH
jgi:hypothetical protein